MRPRHVGAGVFRFFSAFYRAESKELRNPRANRLCGENFSHSNFLHPKHLYFVLTNFTFWYSIRMKLARSSSLCLPTMCPAARVVPIAPVLPVHLPWFPASTEGARGDSFSRSAMSTVGCQLSARISPLECAVPGFPALTPLECAVTKGNNILD